MHPKPVPVPIGDSPSRIFLVALSQCGNALSCMFQRHLGLVMVKEYGRDKQVVDELAMLLVGVRSQRKRKTS
jgi:hypothetical protein